MGEFLRAYLTGDRAARGRRYSAVRFLFALGEFLLAALAILLPMAGVAIPSAWNWGILSAEIAFAAASVLLGFCWRRKTDGLMAEQYEAYEAEYAGEERERYARLYRIYCETRPKRSFRILSLLPDLLTAFVFTGVLLGTTVFRMFEGALPELSVWIVVGVVLFSALCAILQALLGARRENELYDRAGRDLDVLKRQRGLRTSTARNALPEAVRIFLKEESDLNELTERLRRQSMIAGAVVAVLFLVSPVLALLLMSPAAVPVIFGIAGVVLVASLLTCGILGEIEKRAVYRRNRAKLTDSEIDRLRGALQTEWESVQRRGNLLFLCFFLAGFALGGTLGGIFLAGGSGTAVFFGCVGGCVLLMAVLSVVAWSFFYMAAKRRFQVLQNEIVRLLAAVPTEERK